MNNAELKLTEKEIVRDVTVGNVSNSEERALDSFFLEMSKGAHFDSGLLPLDGSGVLAIRKALGHTQIVFQHKPDTYLVTWGGYEGDDSAPTYKVAQPYRVVIGDLIDGQLLGARHFYSPVPLQTGDQILYHVNLPNLNCKGYGDQNGVGWICLYHRSDWSQLSFDNKVRALIERASGAEAYNDDNMSETDGPRFYHEHYGGQASKSFLWDPNVWQQKTANEGIDWTLANDLWIPVLVSGIDSQTRHDPEGIPLTLEMAVLGGYHAYYSDPTQPKPVNAYSRDDLKTPTSKVIFDFLNKAFVTAKKKEVAQQSAPQIPGAQVKILLGQTNQPEQPAEVAEPQSYTAVSTSIGACDFCSMDIEETDDHYIVQGLLVCSADYKAKCGTCSVCATVHTWTSLQTHDDKLYCKNCFTVFDCGNCGKQYFNDNSALFSTAQGSYCLNCAEYDYCQGCSRTFLKGYLQLAHAKDPGTSEGYSAFMLCDECMSTHTICGCGLLKKQEDTGLLASGEYACEPCIKYKEDGTPVFILDALVGNI